ncbi:MAG TPA: sialidase family protein [Candidatus Thermoplasmatota archaeon]|nr:sialidase family protein [Candidatus Thermoplasmatota archaeon]
MLRVFALRPVRVLLAALVAASGLAGCLFADPADEGAPGPGESLARVACMDALCNFVATVDPEGRQANELSVAVNPTNPLNIIATGKDYTPEEAGDCVWAGVYTTHDGGKTWKNQNVPGSPWKRLNDPTTPVTPFSKYWCATDPVVAFGPDGTAYWTVMPYQCDRASGSKLGRDVHPDGGFNDWLWTCSSMFVLVSTDGGDTWPVDRAREVASGARLVHDKQWIAVSPDGGKVLLCWDYANPIEQTAPAPLPAPLPPVDDPAGATRETAVVCSVSTDKGDTWSPMATATDVGGFPWIDFDATGRAWMALQSGFYEGRIWVLSSDDGLSWSEPVAIANFTNGPARNEYGWPTFNGSSFRLVPYGALAIDRSDGPFGGSIYVTYMSFEEGSGNVYVTSSRDGVSWTAPTRATDDGASPNDQFMPVVSVGPDGTVDLSWLDRRDDPDNHLYTAYYAYSLDGGATFSPNLRVGEAMSDEQYSHHQNGMVFLGDYRDADSIAGRSTMVWVDTSREKADVMVATVERPGANGPADASS